MCNGPFIGGHVSQMCGLFMCRFTFGKRYIRYWYIMSYSI